MLIKKSQTHNVSIQLVTGPEVFGGPRGPAPNYRITTNVRQPQIHGPPLGLGF